MNGINIISDIKLQKILPYEGLKFPLRIHIGEKFKNLNQVNRTAFESVIFLLFSQEYNTGSMLTRQH